MPVLPYPTWVEINLPAIEFNTRLITQQVNVPVMAVVKDDAYGHGAVEVSRAFLRAGGTWLAVVRVAEGLELRQAGINAPIIVLGGAVPEEMQVAIANDLAQPVYSFETAELISRAAQAMGKTARVHLKIDTGMGRFGVFPDEALALARRVIELGGMELEGIFSHFASAGEDKALCASQMKDFRQAVDALHQNGIQPRWVHLANSNGVIHEPASYFNLVRVGGVLYGQGPDRTIFPFPVEPQRAFAWKAQLMGCKPFPEGYGIGYSHTYHTQAGEIIGVVPVGYGDGYHRVAGTSVLVGGEKVPVVGRVCMDQFMISLPQHYPIGSEVVLIGRQGGAVIHPEDLQKVWQCTGSGVELVHPRVPRIFVHENEPAQVVLES